MAKLIYSAITSVDGYVADKEGKFGWAEPDEEAHAFINDLERSVGTYLYVRRMKASAVRDLTVGGPDLAGQALRAGLVDDRHLFVAPIILGGGKQSLPDGVRLELELEAERRFEGGMIHLRYRALN